MVRIQLHGRFLVLIDDRVVDFTGPGRRGQQIVALLALRPGTPVPRARLISTLWPDSADSARAAANFTALLSKTRSAIAPLEVAGGGGCLSLALPAGAYVDAPAAESALHAAETAVARRDWRTAWTNALSALFVMQREFLVEFDREEWVMLHRAQLGDAYRRALCAYAEACLEIGGAELPSAQRSAVRLVESDPLSERHHRLLVRVHERRGDRAAALAAFSRMRSTLRDELGTAPGPDSERLLQSLL